MRSQTSIQQHFVVFEYIFYRNIKRTFYKINTHFQNHESHRVHVLEIMSWSAKNIIPGDTGIVATVVKEARDIREQEGNGPITVMSL